MMMVNFLFFYHSCILSIIFVSIFNVPKYFSFRVSSVLYLSPRTASWWSPSCCTTKAYSQLKVSIMCISIVIYRKLSLDGHSSFSSETFCCQWSQKISSLDLIFELIFISMLTSMCHLMYGFYCIFFYFKKNRRSINVLERIVCNPGGSSEDGFKTF